MKIVKPDRSEIFEGHALQQTVSPEPGEFTLAHLSDPHLSSLKDVKVRDLLNKRAFGYLSWKLRRHAEHHDEVLAALLNDMRSTKPDHIAVTGDLTHLGLPGEFQEALKLLRSLGSPSRVTVIPGNHDAYIATAWGRTFQLWSDYMASDVVRGSPRVEKNCSSFFPILRIRGGTALIGVSTAQPTLPFLAVGSIGKPQLRRLENILVETRQRQLLRVLLIHHPPVSGAVSWRKRLTDHAAFQTLLARHGAELILHGHTHRTSLCHLEMPWGRVFAVSAASASAVGRTARSRARYHLCRLIPNAGAWNLILSVRVYSSIDRRFVEESEHRQPLPLPTG
jgi:3',5'-cyclic AMP phosphodiesterase CpdA